MSDEDYLKQEEFDGGRPKNEEKYIVQPDSPSEITPYQEQQNFQQADRDYEEGKNATKPYNVFYDEEQEEKPPKPTLEE